MLVDSHCHLDFPELSENLQSLLDNMEQNGVVAALCVGVNLEDFPRVRKIAEGHSNIYASVGVHPDYEVEEPAANEIAALADHEKVIAIGETGLDYFRLKGDLEWQRERFRNHIRAAKMTEKPL
ncbi:MAG TPA: TatD family hydrolase, partial [Burkholderiales bacterium]|nr:TatD family hydrolase [Burkholderiales bacterium]